MKRGLVYAAISLVLLLSPSRIFASLVINEILPNPVGDDKQNEWVEIKNTGSEDIDILGYKLVDEKGHSLEINSNHTNEGTIAKAGSWIVIFRRGHNEFSLNNTGSETVSLYDAATQSATLLNQGSYDGSNEGKSWGRIPDGSGNFTSSLNPTEDSENKTPDPTPDSTPASAQTPTPTTTPKPTPSPTNPQPDATLEPVDFLASESSTSKQALFQESDVLGETTEAEDLKEATSSSGKFNKGKFLSWVLTLSGLIFLLAAGFPFIKQYLPTKKKPEPKKKAEPSDLHHGS